MPDKKLVAGNKIERKLLAHYLNVSEPGEEAEYERLGKDLEEFNKEFNWETEDSANILGESESKIYAAKPTAEADPNYARYGTKLFSRLQNIIDNRYELDDLAMDEVTVHLWEPVAEGGTTYVAYKEGGWYEVSSAGGDTTGYQIPFTIHYDNHPVKGTFDISTKTFTADSAATGA